MAKGIFITGTDTGVGKTQTVLMLMTALKQQGYKVFGMKPIASGAVLREGELINEDALLIRECCSEPMPYELINPFVFELPIAPSIASVQENQEIDIEQIVAYYYRLASQADFVIVEGVGGWHVPIAHNKLFVDIVRSLNIPVIMVVGLRLGCINHALITAETIKSDDIKLCGWVSNQIEKDILYKKEIINTLNQWLSCKPIADIPYMEDLDPCVTFNYIELARILSPVKIA